MPSSILISSSFFDFAFPPKTDAVDVKKKEDIQRSYDKRYVLSRQSRFNQNKIVFFPMTHFWFAKHVRITGL